MSVGGVVISIFVLVGGLLLALDWLSRVGSGERGEPRAERRDTTRRR
jgi:hypothetical protein